MKMMHKLMSRLTAAVTAAVLLALPLQANAVTTQELYGANMFFTQDTNYTCTLSSAAMLIRRVSYLQGKSNWGSVTESALHGTAWGSGGLIHDFTYNGVHISYCNYENFETQLKAYSGNRTVLFMKLLEQHPEGIVVYDSYHKDVDYNGKYSSGELMVPDTKGDHAILLTKYDKGTGTFWCADPALGVHMPLKQSTREHIDYFDTYWYYDGPAVSVPDVQPEPPKDDNTRERTAQIAEDLLGMTYPNSISFVQDVLSRCKAGTYSSSYYVTEFLVDYVNNHAYYGRSNDYVTAACRDLDANALNKLYAPSYTPRVGDVVVLEDMDNVNFADGPDRLGVVVAVEGEGIAAKVYTIEALNGLVIHDYWSKDTYIWGYCSPLYSGETPNAPPVTEEPDNENIGNLNGDMAINASDAAMLLIAAAAAGTGADSMMTDAQKAAADLNSDSTFDAKDAALILQYAAYTGTGGTDSITAFIAKRG